MANHNKTNKQFMILSAIGIIMVVDAHSWTILSLVTQFFPYNSFFMPMFMFVSGYFFNYIRVKENPIKYVVHKVKSLLLPYFGWMLFYGVLTTILRIFTPIDYGYELTLFNLFVRPWISGNVFDINNPTWFIPVLFLVSICYVLLRLVFGKYWNNWIAAVVLRGFGGVAVYLSIQGYNVGGILTILKTTFFLQFYQLGVLYRERIESAFATNGWQSFGICITAILINVVCLFRYKSIDFGGSELTGFHSDNYFLPLITSLTGISFWLVISKLLVPVLKYNRICNYISNHTFGIMTHHVAFMAAFNWFLAGLAKFVVIENLDIQQIKSWSWYRYEPIQQFRILYFLVGIVGAIAVCWGVDKIKCGLFKK